MYLPSHSAEPPRERAERSRAGTDATADEIRAHERIAQLEAANRELEAFSYCVSHDLRAPLRAIDGFSRLLERRSADRLDAEGREYLEHIVTACGKMAEVIEVVTDLARVTHHEIRRRPIDMAEMARQVARDLAGYGPQRAVQWIAPATLPVFADPALLRVVLVNLLGNAWKYTSRHATARIEVGRLDDVCGVVYFVSDDGAGFDMAQADRLFDAFQRLHGAEEFEGTGVGLALVQRIVRRHGGEIWARAAVERGATFFFTLT